MRYQVGPCRIVNDADMRCMALSSVTCDAPFRSRALDQARTISPSEHVQRTRIKMHVKVEQHVEVGMPTLAPSAFDLKSSIDGDDTQLPHESRPWTPREHAFPAPLKTIQDVLEGLAGDMRHGQGHHEDRVDLPSYGHARCDPALTVASTARDCRTEHIPSDAHMLRCP